MLGVCAFCVVLAWCVCERERGVSSCGNELGGGRRKSRKTHFFFFFEPASARLRLMPCAKISASCVSACDILALASLFSGGKRGGQVEAR